MADISNSDISCIKHPGLSLKLFCEQCEDVICVLCVAEDHNGHHFQKLTDVSEIILKTKLYTDMKTGYDQLSAQFAALRSGIESKVLDHDKEELRMSELIKDNTINLKRQLDNFESKVLEKLSEFYENCRSSLTNTKDKVSVCEKLISDVNLSKKYGDIANDTQSTLKFYTILRQKCKLARAVAEHSNIPDIIYQPSEFIEGKLLGTDQSKNVQSPSSDIETIHVELQGKGQHSCRDTYYDDFGFSSDVAITKGIHNILPLINLKHPITKLIPVSKNSAWMQVGFRLYKLNVQERTVVNFRNDVDDFAVFKDGSVLCLNRLDDYISNLLSDGNIINFGCVKPCHSIFLDINIDDKVAVLVGEELQNSPFNANYFFVLFDKNGIKAKQPIEIMSPSINHRDLHGIKLHSNSENTIFLKNKSCVYLRNFETNVELKFEGIYGLDPPEYFRTTGLTLGPNGSVIVTDDNHPAILLLDKNLAYKRCLFNARNGLRNPTVIEFYDNKLWVVDGNKIIIFDCELD